MPDRVLDLSHYNDVQDWQAVKAAGCIGVIHKFSQGSDYRDPTFAERGEAARDAGLLWGRYHFGDNSDVDDQVANFISGWRTDELLALDLESYGDSTMTLAQAKAFLRAVEDATGCRPVLYSGNLLKEYLGGAADLELAGYRLWLAQYAAAPDCPPGWAEPWLWQHTDSGDWPGINGDVDLDSFEGSAAQLTCQWIGDAVEPPNPPETAISVTIPAGAILTVFSSGPVQIIDRTEA